MIASPSRTTNVRRVLRRALPVAVVALLAVLASGCNWAQPDAAHGNGLTVPGGEFRKLITLHKGESLDVVDPTTGQPATDPATGQPQKTKVLTAPTVAGLLTLRIQYGYFLVEAKRRHLHVTDAQAKSASQSIDQSGQAGTIPSRFKTWLAKALAAQTLLAGDVVQHTSAAEKAQAEQALYDQVKSQLDQTCVEFVASSTQSVVAQAAKDLAGGASFATALATAQQGDSNSGGSAGTPQCVSSLDGLPAELQGPVGTSPIGQLVGPITAQLSDPQTGAAQNAYYVLKVTSRGVPPIESLQPRLEQQFAQDKLTDMQKRFLDKAGMSVDPRYGTWDSKTVQVVPPTGLPAKLLAKLDLNKPKTSTDLSGLGGSGLTGTPGGTGVPGGGSPTGP